MNNNIDTKKSSAILEDLKALFKRFFKVKTIPLVLCLLVDGLFLYIGVIFVFAFAVGDSSEVFLRYVDIIAFLITAILYLTTIALSFTILGDLILRKQTKCQKIKDPEILNRIEPLFNEVYSRAKKLCPTLNNNIELFITDDEDPNAFAVGRRTICITKGLLQEEDNHIKAILGHEFGHLAHKDTDLMLIVNIASMFQNVILAGCHAIIIALRFFFGVVSIGFSLANDSAGSAAGKLFDMFLAGISFIFVTLFRRIWNIISNFCLKLTCREDEFEADEFSLNAGYGTYLIEYFETLPDSEVGSKVKLERFFRMLMNVGSSHPLTWHRIEKLKEKTDNSESLVTVISSEGLDLTETSDTE